MENFPVNIASRTRKSHTPDGLHGTKGACGLDELVRAGSFGTYCSLAVTGRKVIQLSCREIAYTGTLKTNREWRVSLLPTNPY
jgi:hypothetical protein